MLHCTFKNCSLDLFFWSLMDMFRPPDFYIDHFHAYIQFAVKNSSYFQLWSHCHLRGGISGSYDGCTRRGQTCWVYSEGAQKREYSTTDQSGLQNSEPACSEDSCALRSSYALSPLKCCHGWTVHWRADHIYSTLATEKLETSRYQHCTVFRNPRNLFWTNTS